MCLRYVSDPAETIAIRAFAMGVLRRIASSEPDLIPELLQSIEAVLPYSSDTLRNHARIVLDKIEKMGKQQTRRRREFSARPAQARGISP